MTADVIAGRVASRPGHFMPASLVDSQLATLEPLEPDERGIVLDVGQARRRARGGHSPRDVPRRAVTAPPLITGTASRTERHPAPLRTPHILHPRDPIGRPAARSVTRAPS